MLPRVPAIQRCAFRGVPYTHWVVYFYLSGPCPGMKSQEAPAMERRTSNARRDILQAADELFYGSGLRAVSVDEIAAKAGITKKTLYYHFRSKDELFAAYLEARNQPTLE